MSKSELDEFVKGKRREAKIFERLLFIKYLYEDVSVPEASKRLEVSKNTGYNWLERWNEGGFEGLTPDYGGGRPTKLSDQEIDDLKEAVKENEWSTKEIHQYIKERYDVDYSLRNVYKLLRRMGLNLSKPYHKDYRRPEDAEERFKKTR
ncbi:MAG: IS630 family transposase [Halobacteria archaeon]